MSNPISTNVPIESLQLRPSRSAAVTSPLTGSERETASLPFDQTLVKSQLAEAPSLGAVAAKARKAIIETTLEQVSDPEVALHNYARYGGAGEWQIRELNRTAIDSYNKAIGMVTTTTEALLVAFQAMRFKRPEMVEIACTKALDLATSRTDFRDIALFGKAYDYPEIAQTADSRAASLP